MQDELLNYIGFEVKEGDEPKFEDVKSFLNEKFVSVGSLATHPEVDKQLNKRYGERLKRVELDMMKAFKPLAEVSHSDIDSMKIEEAMSFLANKIQTKFDGLSGGDGEQINKLKSDLEREKAGVETLKTAFTQKEQEYKDKIESFKTEKITSKVTEAKNKAFDSLKLDPIKATKIAVKGFKTTFDEEYNVALLDDGSLELRDKKDNRVQDPDKMTESLSLDKAAELLAKREGLWTDEAHKGKPAPKPTTEPTPKPRRQASPAMGLGRPSNWG